jgi:hypothetical protein
LIDAVGGEVYFIMNVLDAAEKDGVSADDAIVELDWLNLNKAILAL